MLLCHPVNIGFLVLCLLPRGYKMAAVVPSIPTIFKAVGMGLGNRLSPQKVIFIKKALPFLEFPQQKYPFISSFRAGAWGHLCLWGELGESKEDFEVNSRWSNSIFHIQWWVLRRKKPSPCLKEISFVFQDYKDLYTRSNSICTWLAKGGSWKNN